MTGSDAVFDTWAWWEVLTATRRGVRLHRKYIQNAGVRVHTSTLAVGELIGRFLSAGDPNHADQVAPLIQSKSEIHPVSLSNAAEGARIRQVLRQVDASASLADGIMAALAAELGASLISGDGAFAGRKRTKSS